jgi:hypothetical protein
LLFEHDIFNVWRAVWAEYSTAAATNINLTSWRFAIA